MNDRQVILESLAEIIRSHVKKPRIEVKVLPGDRSGNFTLIGGYFCIWVEGRKLVTSGDHGWNLLLDREYDLADRDSIERLLVSLDRGFDFFPFHSDAPIPLI